MADRLREAGHYEAFAADPHSASYLAFHLTGRQILDEAPTAPLWSPPVPITDTMSPELQEFWARNNPGLERIEERIRVGALEKLRLAGVPDDRLAEPLSPEVSDIVKELVTGARFGLRVLDGDGEAESQRRPFKHVWSIIAAACALAREPASSENVVFDRVANSMKRGVPADAKWKFTRHHVRRAELSWKKKLLSICARAPEARRDLVLRAAVLEAHLPFETLDFIYRQSREHGEFRHLEGRALALAIHHSRDLVKCFDRADDAMKASRFSAG